MYKISVPVMNINLKRNGRERTFEELKRFNAERVFLALDRYELDPERKKNALEELADNCRYFKERGYEVGAWIWTFMTNGENTFGKMRSIKGEDIPGNICPTDKDFVKFASNYIADIAKCGVDLIQFDDDFRYGFLSAHDAPACLCDTHIDMINRITGEVSTREKLEKYITTGGKNKFRDAFLKANGDAFRSFAASVREAVDKINPDVRVGFCACMTSWDIDGTDARELAKILAGNTRPFVRLIGAPYWGFNRSWGNYIQDAIELERMESAWTKDGEIEIMAEGDVFPRPRTTCPASYLEGFDTALRASGATDGILKYGIDYHSNADYETGYAEFHERNKELYSAIDRIFEGKTSCGIRVYETMNKVADAVTPTAVNESTNVQNLFFSKAARSLAFNTIPTVYEGEGVCGICFDENARALPLSALKGGLILDLAAAEILTERGVDVGIKKIGKKTCGDLECFKADNNHIYTRGAVINELEVKDGVEILSTVEASGNTVPFSYRYENSDGNRFLVLNINTRVSSDNLLKHYARSRQYAEAVQWFGGKKLPAYAYGHPALYIQCKKDNNGMAVGLWNFFEDTAIEPVIELGKEYSKIEFINCNGRLEGDKVHLTDIPPFGFVAFEVK